MAVAPASAGDRTLPTHAESGSMSITVKPFGKDGVRVLWSRGDGCGEVDVEAHVGAGWVVHARVGACGDREGVVVVKTLKSDAAGGPGRSPPPAKSCGWRLRDPRTETFTGEVRLPGAGGDGRGGSRGCVARAAAIDDAEVAVNMLLWYSTVVVDCRGGGVPRVCESLYHSGDDQDSTGTAGGDSFAAMATAAAALPLRDDALCFEAPDAVLAALAPRIRRGVYTVPRGVVSRILTDYPFMVDRDAGGLRRRPVIPNIIDDRLLVGHQGHALSIEHWAGPLDVRGVVNLAPDKVPAVAARAAVGAEHGPHVLEVYHGGDGRALADTPGDGQRLLEVLPAVLAHIARVLGAAPRGRVFIHCQQGRSRAGSIVVAQLLATHPSWCLHDALAFVAARRPEVEINVGYAEALETWALEMGRPASLERIHAELRQHVRYSGGGPHVVDRK